MVFILKKKKMLTNLYLFIIIFINKYLSRYLPIFSVNLNLQTSKGLKFFYKSKTRKLSSADSRDDDELKLKRKTYFKNIFLNI